MLMDPKAKDYFYASNTNVKLCKGAVFGDSFMESNPSKASAG